MPSTNSSRFTTRIRTALAALTALSLLAGLTDTARADRGGEHPGNQHIYMNAGTTFDFHPTFDANGPVFPWQHEVRGVVQVSHLGNCTVQFNVEINSGAICPGSHAFCLSGTMRITTLAGDELQATLTGWGDPDPNDPTQPARMNLLHYDVTITGGTGKLEGAKGQGDIDGTFFFCQDNCFCDSYQGVATWLFEGVLQLPKRRGK